MTPPNHASITLLAEEGGRTCLLTGDAADDEILDGLRGGREAQARAGSTATSSRSSTTAREDNLDKGFASAVLADHYVFCADGANNNPEPDVIRTIADCRAAADPRPFTLWFNTTPARTLRPGARRWAPGSPRHARPRAATPASPSTCSVARRRSSSSRSDRRPVGADQHRRADGPGGDRVELARR